MQKNVKTTAIKYDRYISFMIAMSSQKVVVLLKNSHIMWIYL